MSNVAMSQDPEISLQKAKEAAALLAEAETYTAFVETVRREFPWRFEKIPMDVLERDYLRIVDHHLEHLVPCMQKYLEPHIRNVLDFGCGSGGSAIALALAYPHIHFEGTDIDPKEIAMARQRAKVYGVADRCHFHHVSPGEPLPFEPGFFDLSLCSSVLEYATDFSVRRFCIREMARLVKRGGLLFFSVPNRLYPFEIHTRKWGWNYFPTWLHARTVDSTYWEVRRLARPSVLKLHRTPLHQLFTPWSQFCLQKEA